MARSDLGLDFADGGDRRALRLEQAFHRAIDETWRPVWGADAEVRDRANELRLDPGEADAPRPGRRPAAPSALFNAVPNPFHPQTLLRLRPPGCRLAGRTT